MAGKKMKNQEWLIRILPSLFCYHTILLPQNIDARNTYHAKKTVVYLTDSTYETRNAITGTNASKSFIFDGTIDLNTSM